MNKKIGFWGSSLNLAAVICFAISLIAGSAYAGYLSSTFIALGFMAMTCAYAHYADEKRKAAGYLAAILSAAYAVLIFIVYFAQMTAVQFGNLSDSAMNVLDYSTFGLMFTYDLVGYALMALATVFAGLTIEPKNKADKWLKALLLIHGVFFLSCFFMPLFNVFSTESAGSSSIGTSLLEFWCAYFTPIGILSMLHFRKKSE